MTDTHTHDFVLLGISDGDIPISGPFDEAISVLQMMVAEGLSDDERDGYAVQLAVDPDLQRAVLSVVAFDDDGSVSVSSVFLMPIPRIDDRETVVALTDIGRWEMEMRQHMESKEEGQDNA